MSSSIVRYESVIEGLNGVKATSFKSTPSGLLLVQESGSNDLIVYENTGKELVRHKGIARFDGGNFQVTRDNKERNAHSPTETDKVVWFSGYTNIIVVALKDLSMLDLANFLPHGEMFNGPIPIRAAMADSCDTIVVYFKTNDIQCLAYLNPLRKEPSNYLVADFCEDSKIQSISEEGTLH